MLRGLNLFMKLNFTKVTSLLLVILLMFSITGCTTEATYEQLVEENHEEIILGVEKSIDENEAYTSKEEVALFIHTYGKLPINFISKKEAAEVGWESSEGNLWDVADGMSIGGDKFGNREGLLPKKEKRQYYECDINYEGGYRGSERIVYSNDGLIYYTADHYDSFELLYGGE